MMILMYRGMLPPLWLSNKKWAMRLHNQTEGVPYGLALTAAALWVFPTTAWFASVA
jgi:prepilin peptidase CpaA